VIAGSLRQALITNPARAGAAAEIAMDRLRANDSRSALAWSRRARAADPLEPLVYLALGNMFRQLHFSLARYFQLPDLANRRAVLLAPGDEAALTQFVSADRHFDGDRLWRWIGWLGCVARPGALSSVVRVAKSFELGETKLARGEARGELQANPGNIAMAVELSAGFEPGDADLLSRIASAVERHPQAGADARAKAALIAARLAHRQKKPAQALAALGRLRRALTPLLVPGSTERMCAALEAESVDAARLPSARRGATGDIGLVLVSGLPRSGTTLTATQLATADGVFDLGETYLLESAYQHLKSGVTTPARAGREVASAFRAESPGDHWFVEKMPVVVAYDGAARALVPRVRTLIIVRPFLGTWLSGALGGFGAKHPYFQSAAETLMLYRTHLEIAAAALARLPAEEVAVITLEGLSDDPDGVVAALAGRFGLPSSADKNRPSGTRRIVRTASRSSVRGSVDRRVGDQYAPYLAHLDPETRAIVEQGDDVRARFLDAHAALLVGDRD